MDTTTFKVTFEFSGEELWELQAKANSHNIRLAPYMKSLILKNAKHYRSHKSKGTKKAIQLPLEEIEMLMELHWSFGELAAKYGVSERTIKTQLLGT